MSFKTNGVELKNQFHLKNTDPIDSRYVITSKDEYKSLMDTDDNGYKFLYPGLTFAVTADLGSVTLNDNKTTVDVNKGIYRVASDGKTVNPCYGNLVAGTNISFTSDADDSITINVGTDYSDGVGIETADIVYATGTKDAPESPKFDSADAWLSTAPAWEEGKYIWQRVKFTYTNDNIEYSEPWCSQGVAGRSMKTVEEWYLLSKAASGITKSSTGTDAAGTTTNVKWSTTLTNPTKAAPYLWNYEVIKDDLGNTINETTPVVLLKYTEDGRGVKDIKNWYLTTDAVTGVTANTVGWKNTPDITTSEKPYLWNYEEIEWTSADANGKTKTTTTPAIIGVHGQDGTGVEIKGSAFVPDGYTITTHTTTILYSDAEKTQQIINPVDGDSYLIDGYLFVYTGATNAKFLCAGPIQGPEGRGISNCVEHYMASSRATGVEAGDDGENADLGEEWIIAGGDTPLPAISASKPYLWNYESILYSDGTEVTFDATIVGTWGSDGRGITSITEYYAVNNNKTIPPTSWTEAKTDWIMPTTSNSNKYLWNYEKITWSDGSSTTTTPVIVGTHGDPGSSTEASVTATDSEYFIYWNTTKSAPTTSATTKGFNYKLLDEDGNTIKDGQIESNITVDDPKTVHSIEFSQSTLGWMSVASNTPDLDRYQPIFKVKKITINGNVVYTIPELMNKDCTGLGVFCRLTDQSVIDGGTITAGSITADQIAANSITADHLSADALTVNIADIGGWKHDDKAIYSDPDESSAISGMSSIDNQIPTLASILPSTLEVAQEVNTQTYGIRVPSGTTKSNIKTVTVPMFYVSAEDGTKYLIEALATEAFSECTNLTTVNLPPSIRFTGSYAFKNCTKLETISLPDSLETLRSATFYGCTSLKSIVIPDKVASIGEWAFYNCTSLTSLEIPDGVTSIARCTFWQCTSLTELVIPTSVISISSSVFQQCVDTTIKYRGTEAQWNAIQKASDWKGNAKNLNVTYNYTGSPVENSYSYALTVMPHKSLVDARKCSPPRFFAGYEQSSTATIPNFEDNPNFLVLEDGSMYARAANISGTIFATNGVFSGDVRAKSGDIGGLNIYNNSISTADGGLAFTSEGVVKTKFLEVSDALSVSKLDTTSLSTGAITGLAATVNALETLTLESSYQVTKEGTTHWLLGITDEGTVTVTIRAKDAAKNNKNLVQSKAITIAAIYSANGNIDQYSHREEKTITFAANSNSTTVTFPHIMEYEYYHNYSAQAGGRYTGSNYTLLKGTFLQAELVTSSIRQPQSSESKAVTVSGHLLPEPNADEEPQWNLGGSDNKQKWNDIYTKNATLNGSDRNIKDNIEELTDNYELLFDNLRPVKYKFKQNESNRTHTGFIAQEVEDAVIAAGLTTKDFAAVCYDVTETGKQNYNLRYSEFISLNTYMIQKLKKENEALKQLNEALEARLEAIEKKLGSL